MSDKPVILIIENSIDVTGALKSIARAASDLKEFYTFQFLIPIHSNSKAYLDVNGFSTVHELPLLEINKRILSLFLYLPTLLVNSVRLKAIIKKNRITLLHVNDLYNLLPVIIRFVGLKTPYVCHIRFLPDRFPAWLFNFWLRLHIRFAEKIIVVSKSVEQMLPAHPKIKMIYNELPINERYPATMASPSHTLLYLSNFIKGKGQLFALQAFANIHESLPGWRLRFVGGDMGLKKNKAYKKMLKDESEIFKVAEKVEWVEFTNDVEKEYKQADVVLNFSESESFSMTCVEALYFGRPLIATDCGGPSEIIEHGVTGILVPNRNVEAMSKAIMELARDKQKQEVLGAAARQSVRDKFNVKKTSFRIRETYDSAIMRK
jgi:L-malate glycosyltransferase